MRGVRERREDGVLTREPQAVSKVRGGFEPRFNPGSNSKAGSEGGEAEYQHQEPGFNPGSTQVQTRFNPGSTQV